MRISEAGFGGRLEPLPRAWWGVVVVDICFFRPKENIRVCIVIDAAGGKSADWMVGVKKRRRSVVGMLLQGLQMTPAIVKSAFTLNLP